MKGLAVIKVTRAIRRLASAITPGTSPEHSDGMLEEAAALIAEAQAMGGVISRPELEPEPDDARPIVQLDDSEADVPIVRLDDAITSYCEALTLNGRCADSETVVYTPDPRGRKYTRIVRTTTAKGPDGGHVRGDAQVTSRSVAAFVKREGGTIRKADGWKGPALNFPRGNVYEPESYAAHLHGYGL